MDDGHKTFYNQTVLNTNSYTIEEVQLLQAALLKNFQLRTRLIEKMPGVYLIVIPVRQIRPLNQLVGTHIIESMQYKIKSKLDIKM